MSLYIAENQDVHFLFLQVTVKPACKWTMMMDLNSASDKKPEPPA